MGAPVLLAIIILALIVAAGLLANLFGLVGMLEMLKAQAEARSGRLPQRGVVPVPVHLVVDVEPIREALAAIPDCPANVREAVEEYLSMSDGDARLRKAGELLTMLYNRASFSNEDYAHRAGYNRLRLAIRGSSD